MNKPKYMPKYILKVVYQKSNKRWRGFCFPFDVTCETETAKKAKEQLTEAVSLYIEGLEKYDYPKHLSIRPLSEGRDEEVLRKVLKKIAALIKRKMVENPSRFQEERKTEKVYFKNPPIQANYQPCFV